MKKPTCYVRFDAAGKTVVWTNCPGCGHEIIIHPQPGTLGQQRPWFDLRCGGCGRTPREIADSEAQEG